MARHLEMCLLCCILKLFRVYTSLRLLEKFPIFFYWICFDSAIFAVYGTWSTSRSVPTSLCIIQRIFTTPNSTSNQITPFTRKNQKPTCSIFLNFRKNFLRLFCCFFNSSKYVFLLRIRAKLCLSLYRCIGVIPIRTSPYNLYFI